MDTISEIAARFLSACIGGGARPGQIVGPDKFKGPVSMPGQMADFPKALEYAVEQGWLEKAGSDGYRLTIAGYATAQISK